VAAEHLAGCIPCPLGMLNKCRKTLSDYDYMITRNSESPGLTNEYDMFISQSCMEKNWNFEYIDLSLLFKQNFVHNTQENQNTLQIIDGKLVVQSKSKNAKSIDSIQMWTEAFITYIQLIIEVKYIRIILSPHLMHLVVT
jgi:hypothetical protein